MGGSPSIGGGTTDAPESFEFGYVKLGDFEDPIVEHGLATIANVNASLTHKTCDDTFPQSLVRLSGMLTPNSQIFLYIHGYNVSFEGALSNAARLMKGLHFEGFVVCVAWGSKNKTMAYMADESRATAASSAMRDLLEKLAKLPWSTHILAHSMGNRVLLDAVSRLRAPDACLGEIFSVSPDVRKDAFVELVETGAKQKSGKKTPGAKYPSSVTVYVNEGDKALGFSQIIHQDERAGKGTGRIEGVDFINCGSVARDAIQHSFYCEPEVLTDMRFKIKTGAAAGHRVGGTLKREAEGFELLSLSEIVNNVQFQDGTAQGGLALVATQRSSTSGYPEGPAAVAAEQPQPAAPNSRHPVLAARTLVFPKGQPLGKMSSQHGIDGFSLIGADGTSVTMLIDYGFPKTKMVHAGLLFENPRGFRLGDDTFQYTLMHRRIDDIILLASNDKQVLTSECNPDGIMCFNLGTLLEMRLGVSKKPPNVLVVAINASLGMDFDLDAEQAWYRKQGFTNSVDTAQTIGKALTEWSLTFAEWKSKAAELFADCSTIGDRGVLIRAGELAKHHRQRRADEVIHVGGVHLPSSQEQ